MVVTPKGRASWRATAALSQVTVCRSFWLRLTTSTEKREKFQCTTLRGGRAEMAAKRSKASGGLRGKRELRVTTQASGVLNCE